MKHLTIITGYPRSRLAWLATFLNMDLEVFAFHEATVSCATVLEYFRKLRMRSEDYVVDCNCALLQKPDLMLKIREEFNPEIILVERPIEECRESLKRFLPSAQPDFDLMDDTSSRLDLMDEAMIPVEKLDNIEACREILGIVKRRFTSMIKINEDKFQELVRKNIQQHIPKTLATI